MDSLPIYLTVLFFLTIASGFFSGGEVALFSLSSHRIMAYQSSKKPREQLIARLISHSKDLLVTLFLLNTLVNILIQNVSSSLFGQDAGWDLKIGFPLILTLFVGEILPKYICLQNNVKAAYFFSPIIALFHSLVAPIRKILVAITTPLSQILFFFLKREKGITTEELKHVLYTSERHGILTQDETELVNGYLNLQDSIVKEVIRPKEDILYYELSDPLTKLLYLFIEQRCTRIPVSTGGIQHIIGIISAKDYFIHQTKIQSPEDIKQFLQKPYFIPETMPTKLLLKVFYETHAEMALAVNEYGSITGLATLEDIVELVIGDVLDLRDTQVLYSPAGKNAIIANGRFELIDVNALFHSNLTSKNNRITIGGWLEEIMDEIPKSGSKFSYDSFVFHILSATPKRILKVYIRQIQPARKDAKK